MKTRTQLITPLLAGILLLAGCATEPPYRRPTVETPSSFKEGGALWRQAQPSDGKLKGNWWEMYGDSALNGYEAQVNVSNQTVALEEADYRAARALVKEAQSQFFPLIGIDPSVSLSRAANNGSAKTSALYSLPAEVSWEPDLWGRVAEMAKAAKLEAVATQADLENARLSVQAELASDYFQLRMLDAQKELLDKTVRAYQKYLDITEARFQTGIASDQDVAQAQNQLAAARAQATDVGVARAQFEHAIAMLVGKAASDFSISPNGLLPGAPDIPPSTPSQLLERRPDISAAQRRVAEANANIGVAKAAFFPDVTLTASAGIQSAALGSLISSPTAVWGLGGEAAAVFFNGGLYGAQLEQAKAVYDENVANYRQTVLAAFQEVEDNLAATRILADEKKQWDLAVGAAQRSLDLEQSRYSTGIDDYLAVLTAQANLYANERSALSISLGQLTDSVQLVKALGGRWDAGGKPAAKAAPAQAKAKKGFWRTLIPILN